jgi:hypothetical protein
MATTTSATLIKDTWVLFQKTGETQIISIEEGSLAYWRLGTNSTTKGHSMEIGDLITFYENVYLKSVGKDTLVSVTT